MKRRKTPAGRPESALSEPANEAFDPGLEQTGSDAEPAASDLGGIRLNKFLAQNGIASRRRADELIARGHVTVDGRIVTELGLRIDPSRSKVEAGGVVLKPEGERPCYYLLNKPKGVVCTNDPHEARTRAVDLVTDRRKGRIYTVGRLDEDTEGLVILTNDGEFANRISHPRYGVKKTYWVDVRGRVADEALQEMQKGVRLAEGWAGFERVQLLRRHDERSILLVTLAEGKNREVRRVLAHLGLPVRNLRRVTIGPLRDGRLKLGHWRALTKAEVGGLLAATEPGQTTREPAHTLRPIRRRRFQSGNTVARRPWSKKKPKSGGGQRERRGRGPNTSGPRGRR